jgi:RNA polymerase sigma-70 factor (ECF subfamily)
MKNKKIKKAPLYLVMSSVSNKGIKMRIFPLMRAIKTKDGLNWSYPSADGIKKVPVKSLNTIDVSNNLSYKSYTETKSQIETLSQEILNKHQKYLKDKTKPKSVIAAPIIIDIIKTLPVPVPVVISEAKVLPLIKKVPVKSLNKNQEDQKAVESMLAGNKNAFTGIYKRYYAMIRQKYMTSIRFNQEIVDDLIQDLFIKVSENISKYSPEYTFNSWITKVAKNHLVDYLRKGKLDIVSYDRNIFNDEGDEMLFQPQDNNTLNGEEIIINKESKASLHEALNMLDEDSRKIVMLRYFEELSYEEIVKQENISEAQLKIVLFRAKAKLNRILQTNRALMTACSNHIAACSN